MYFYFCILKAARSPYGAQNGLKLDLCLRLTSAEITGVIHVLLKFFVFTNSNNKKEIFSIFPIYCNIAKH